MISDEYESIPVIVELIEPIGSETHVLMRPGPARLTAAFKEWLSFRIGETIQRGLDPAHASLFDVKGDRLRL